MTDSRSLAFIGAALLFLGVFVPLFSVPIIGTVNYFANGSGDGTIILGLAAVTVFLAATGRTRFVLFTGLASLAMLALTFIRYQSSVSEMRAKMDAEIGPDNPFRGIAEAAAGAIQMQWGWAVLILGAVIVTYAGWASRKTGGPADQ